MPFTVSHAAAVLPFRRTGLIWSALVIGSFGPDFEYFLRMSAGSRAWHHFPAVFLYCLPFTVLAFYLFQGVMKRPIVALLPVSIQRRLDPGGNPFPKTFSNILVLLVSLLIGIGTHLLWDSFTHPGDWPTTHIAALRETLGLPFAPYLRGWSLAQSLSTVAGLFILGISLTLWYRKTASSRNIALLRVPSRVKLTICLGIIAISLAGGAWHAYSLWGFQRLSLHGEMVQVDFVIATISWFLWQLLGYSAVVTILQKTKGAHR